MVDISSLVDATLALIGMMAVLGMGCATMSLQSVQPMSTTTPEHHSTCDEFRSAA